MFRFCFLTLCFALPLAASAVAQTTPEKKPPLVISLPVKGTLDAESLLNETKTLLAQAEPKIRTAGLFRLLDFQMQPDKNGLPPADNSAAKETINALLTLAPTIAEEPMRNQLYRGVIDAYSDLQEDAEAVKIIAKITKPADRADAQINYAARVISELEESKTENKTDNKAESKTEKKPRKPFDVLPLLRQGIADAAAAQRTSKEYAALEAVGHTFLGRELARQGKNEDADAAFAEALKTAKKAGDTEEQELVGLVLRCQIQYGRIPAAAATLNAVTVAETKQALTDVFIQELIFRKKFAEAEPYIKKMPVGKPRDAALFDFIMGLVKTITDEKVGELTALTSAEAVREQMLQQVVAELRQNNRNDAAQAVGKRLNDPKKYQAAVIFGDLETLMEAKKFAEALKLGGSLEDPELKVSIQREILIAQYRETQAEAALTQIAALYTAEEKGKLTKLAGTAKTAAEETPPNTDTLLEVTEGQFEMMDIPGAKQTMALILARLGKVTDPTKVVQCRLVLARLQMELQDKKGAKENLVQLLQMLDGVKDINQLKGLVGGVAASGGRAPVVDAAAIRSQLFQVYAAAAELLTQTDAMPEAKTALSKAKVLADGEAFAIAKADKLLLLARILRNSSAKN